MRGLRFTYIFFFFFSCVTSSYGQTGMANEDLPGVSYALAVHRAAVVRNVRYALSFSIPGRKELPVWGEEKISFELRPNAGVLLLDFKAPASALRWVRVNGHAAALQLR